MKPVQFGSTGALTLPSTVELNPGRVLTVRVNSVFSDGRLRISLDGSFLIADRSQNLPALTEGSELRAVVRGNDSSGRVVLELVPDEESGLLRRLNLPDTELSRIVTEAFARSGLALDPVSIETAVRRLRAAREDLPLAARLIALLRHKGLPDSLDSALLPVLTTATDTPTGDEQDSDGKQNQHPRKHAHYQQWGRESGGGDTSKSGSSTREKLARTLYEYIEQGSDSIHELHLFNHYKRSAPHWTIIPLQVDPFERVTLAIRFDSQGKSEMATLRISWDEVRFQAHWSAGENRVRMATNSAGIADLGNGNLPALSGQLQRLGFRVDRIVVSSSLDGFSDEAVEEILRPFDRNV